MSLLAAPGVNFNRVLVSPTGDHAGVNAQTDAGRTRLAFDKPSTMLFNSTFVAKIGGVITQEGTVVRRTVRVYARDTGALAGTYLSRHDGTYDFSNLDPARLYYVVAVDASAAPVYNDMIAGQIEPVLTGVATNSNYPPGGTL